MREVVSKRLLLVSQELWTSLLLYFGLIDSKTDFSQAIAINKT